MKSQWVPVKTGSHFPPGAWNQLQLELCSPEQMYSVIDTGNRIKYSREIYGPLSFDTTILTTK